MSWGRDGDRVFFSGEFTDVGVRLLKHPWSGFVKFILDGVNVGEVDLYNADESKVHWVPIAHDLSPGTHTLEIVSSSKQNPQSQARQIFFHELVVSRPRQKSFMEEEREDINRVLPLFPSVLELMRETPKDGLILDCGSGDRVFRDPRYVSVDCQQYQLPLVYADVLKLPFRNGTFDCVISQALLEHVPDPFAAVREMVRVTKPGGKLWSGMAFMQPLHAIPSHYFNATPWGIQELFRSVEILELKWFGELSFTIDWLLKAAGIAGRLPEVRYQALIEQIKSFDAMVSYEALRAVASGVSVLARKPV
jgi:SAM-dependent methyltransferase